MEHCKSSAKGKVHSNTGISQETRKSQIHNQTQAAATGALSAAKRRYPTSKVRGGSQEDPMPKGRWPRGVITRLRSGAAAESARLRWRRKGREELPHVQGQEGGGREEIPRDQCQGRQLGGATPHPQAQGQGRQPGEPTPHPRSHGCASTGGPRGDIPP